MERKTCMCGYSTDKSNKWDDDLDQCKKCTKEQNKKMQKIEEIQDYLDTFEVGDFVCWRNRLHILVEKTPTTDGGMWRLLDPTTITIHNMYVRNWLIFPDCPNLHEVICKWTETDRS